jgi:hypothetical protein
MQSATSTPKQRRRAWRHAQQRPTDTDVDLVESLIKSKTMQTGLVGAVTSAGSVIPGFGTLASFTLGVATDVGMTLKMQSELVMEIAAVHGHDLSQQERRNAMMMVTGVNLGSERLVNQASRKLAQKVTERFRRPCLCKGHPLRRHRRIGRSQHGDNLHDRQTSRCLLQPGPDSDHDWDESFRALSGLDERKLADWLSEVMTDLGRALGDGAQRTGRSAAWGAPASTAATGGLDAMRAQRVRLASRWLSRRSRMDDGSQGDSNRRITATTMEGSR